MVHKYEKTIYSKDGFIKNINLLNILLFLCFHIYGSLSLSLSLSHWYIKVHQSVCILMIRKVSISFFYSFFFCINTFYPERIVITRIIHYTMKISAKNSFNNCHSINSLTDQWYIHVCICVCVYIYIYIYIYICIYIYIIWR